MKKPAIHSKAFTLVELLISMAVAGILGAGILLYSSTALRMISRNLTVNHSHDAVRVSTERMLADLHGSASVFTLVNFNGTTYSDVTPTSTADKDAYSGRYASTRANGVRFWRLAGGPYRLVGDGMGASPVSSTATTLKFEFGVDANGDPSPGGQLPYIPADGDKLQIPLISSEFDITVLTPPAIGNTQGVVTISGSTGTGFTLYTSGTTPWGGSNPIVTGYFYHRVGYTVWNNQLRYHPNYLPRVPSDTILIRNNITSPSPFALLFSGTSADILNLRVSLEAYDMDYSNRLYNNGTTTLQDIIPSRTQPATLNTH